MDRVDADSEITIKCYLIIERKGERIKFMYSKYTWLLLLNPTLLLFLPLEAIYISTLSTENDSGILAVHSHENYANLLIQQQLFFHFILQPTKF